MNLESLRQYLESMKKDMAYAYVLLEREEDYTNAGARALISRYVSREEIDKAHAEYERIEAEDDDGDEYITHKIVVDEYLPNGDFRGAKAVIESDRGSAETNFLNEIQGCMNGLPKPVTCRFVKGGFNDTHNGAIAHICEGEEGEILRYSIELMEV